MGRPASNGAPSFRFNSAEVAEMESILQAHKCTVPERDLCQALADKFSRSAERDGKVVVQMKQIWNWFQNRRYAIRAKNARPPGKLNAAPLQRNDLPTVKSSSQAPQHLPHVPPASSLNNMVQVPQPIPPHSVPNATKHVADNSPLEFEAKSSRDGAWYDVSLFLSHRSMENDGPAVLVRFAGFGSEEDEWINVQKNVRLRSLPCESSECVAVLPNDLILCFQEGKEQALYYDAHVLDAQRRRHDARGCRCRFLVRYDHDQSEEIVALRKVCRRPETDYRLQQLHDQNKSGYMHHHPGNSVQVPPVTAGDSSEKKAAAVVIPAETTPKQPVTGVHPKSDIPVRTPVSSGNNIRSKMSAVEPLVHLSTSSAGDGNSGVSTVTTTVPDPVPVVSDSTSKQPTTMFTSGVGAYTDTVICLFAPTNTSVSTPIAPMDHSNAPPGFAVGSNVSTAINTVPVDDSMPMQPPVITITAGVDANTCEMPMNHLNSPSAPTSAVPVSVTDTTPDQPGNTPPLVAPDTVASADVNISTVPDSHSNASLYSASAGAVDSSVSPMVIDTDAAAPSSVPNQPSSTGEDANSGAVISPVSPANTPSSFALAAGVVDTSVESVTNTVSPATLNETPVVTDITTSVEKLERSGTIDDDDGNLITADHVVVDSGSSLNYTASPGTLHDSPEITISLEELERSGIIDDEGNLMTVDPDPVVASDAAIISNVTEDAGLASGPTLISAVSEDPGVASGVTGDPGLSSGPNHISDDTEDPGENMQID